VGVDVGVGADVGVDVGVSVFSRPDFGLEAASMHFSSNIEAQAKAADSPAINNLHARPQILFAPFLLNPGNKLGLSAVRPPLPTIDSLSFLWELSHCHRSSAFVTLSAISS
jgi:hypothetical protein